MKFVAGPVNKQLLLNYVHACTPVCSEVLVAVAYANRDNLHLFEACEAHGKPLTFYGRYDTSIPVHPDVIQWFLSKTSLNYECRMVPDILHAKVIWWRDVGVYIGSSNLSDKSWHQNIEAGTFHTQDEIEELDMLPDLVNFFEVTHSHSNAISAEFHKHLLKLQDHRSALAQAEFEYEKSAPRFYPETKPLFEQISVAKSKRAFDDFERAWRESLQTLRTISKIVVSDEYRPHWIPNSIPTGAQADQFIHAYYYKNIAGHRGERIVEEAHARNRLNPDAALIEALKWWKKSDFDYEDEKLHLTEWATSLESVFAKSTLKSISKDQFVGALSKVHAVRDYASKQNKADLGLSSTASYEEKLTAHVSALWDNRSKHGTSIPELLDYVIWGGRTVEERIWEGVHSDKWSISGIGFSTLGEIVGWARPNEFPPRNNRTIKGLRALGQSVRSV